MTAQGPAAPAPSTQDLEAFLQRFFGRGNDAWPNMDPDPGKGDRARPFVDLLRSGSDIPIVLPRYQQAQDLFAIYVIARDDAHATLVGNIITAFAGATYLSGAACTPAPWTPTIQSKQRCRSSPERRRPPSGSRPTPTAASARG